MEEEFPQTVDALATVHIGDAFGWQRRAIKDHDRFDLPLEQSFDESSDVLDVPERARNRSSQRRRSFERDQYLPIGRFLLC